MADPSLHLQAQGHELPSKHLRHSISMGPPKSKPTSLLSRILRKSLLFLLLLVAIPFFPSQAPNFITPSLLTHFWELLHLLVIGLLVSYGFFSRRNVDGQFEPSSYLDDSQSSLVSRIFHACPFFEDGYEISSGVDEKIVSQSCNFDNVGSCRFDRCELEGVCEGRSLESEGDLETCFEHGEINEVQAWSSQYFQGDSVVVMSNAGHEFDGYGSCGPLASHGSLGLPVRSLNSGLPVRSLNSGTGNLDSPVLERSNPRLNEGLRGDSISESVKEFRELGSWDFTVGRVELGEEEGSGRSVSTRFRPLSVEETRIESLKSQASSMSGSPSRFSHSSSVSSEANSEAEEAERRKSFRASYPPAFQSPLKSLNGETPLNAFHLRRYSSGSLFSQNSETSSKDKLKGLRGSRREDLVSSIQKEHGSDELDKKHEAPVKAMTRGKSVRTIRSNWYAEDGLEARDVIKSKMYDEFERNSSEAKAIRLDEMKREGSTYLSTEPTKANVVSRREVSKAVYEEYHNKKGKEECYGNGTVEAEEDSQSETETFQPTSDRSGVTSAIKDEGYDSNEVDRKAGEFIAKFKEQIRLQKVASMDRSRGTRLVGNHLG